MTNPEQLREQAGRLLEQRTLDTLSAKITDPVWRDRAQQFASGRMSAQDVLAYIERSPAVMRCFDRHLIKLTELSDDELTALRAQRDQHIDQIAEELANQTRPRPQRPTVRTGRAQTGPEDESSWEDGTWMEQA